MYSNSNEDKFMTVKKRYRIALETKLDQLHHQGYAIFERWELLAWFDKERLTNVVWREIQDSWEEIFGLKEGQRPLQVIKCDLTTAPQTFLIVQADRIEDMDNLV
jgi:hypothetical protein